MFQYEILSIATTIYLKFIMCQTCVNYFSFDLQLGFQVGIFIFPIKHNIIDREVNLTKVLKPVTSFGRLLWYYQLSLFLTNITLILLGLVVCPISLIKFFKKMFSSFPHLVLVLWYSSIQREVSKHWWVGFLKKRTFNFLSFLLYSLLLQIRMQM